MGQSHWIRAVEFLLFIYILLQEYLVLNVFAHVSLIQGAISMCSGNNNAPPLFALPYATQHTQQQSVSSRISSVNDASIVLFGNLFIWFQYLRMCECEVCEYGLICCPLNVECCICALRLRLRCRVVIDGKQLQKKTVRKINLRSGKIEWLKKCYIEWLLKYLPDYRFNQSIYVLR